MLPTTNITKQFTGKIFWITLAAAVILEVTSFFVIHTWIEGVILGLILIAVAVLALYRTEWALYIAFAELIISSMGRMFVFEIGGFDLTMRIGIFAVIMIVWLFKFAQKGRWDQLFKVKYKRPLLLIAAAVTLGFILGLTDNNPQSVFLDGNAYLFFAYFLPVSLVLTESRHLRGLLQVLFAGFMWIFVKTCLVFYAFTHFGEGVQLYLYQWVRDTRVGEITAMDYGFYRIFFQSHIFVILVLCLAGGLLWFFWKKNQTGIFVLFGVAVTVLILGLSRSFWLGIVVMAFFMIFFLIRFLKVDYKEFFVKSGFIILAFVTSLLFIYSLAAFPYPAGNADMGRFRDLLSDRFSDTEEVSLRSRWELLPAMWDRLVEDAIFGAGFGTEVTYQSFDPRVHNDESEGIFTTYSFEWGFLDIWLKTGIWGLIGFIWLGILMLRDSMLSIRSSKGWMYFGFALMIVALYTIHVFTPYLNHPLGIGILLFITPFLKQRPLAEVEKVEEKSRKKAIKFQLKTAVSQRKSN